MSKTAKAALALAAALVLGLWWLASTLYTKIPPSPAAAMKSFYELDVAEDQLMDPLILAGPGVIPLLEPVLMDPDMPRRRYAIGALGNIGDRSALPLLERVIKTDSEPDYIRCDALSAMAMIDRGTADQWIRAIPGLQRECEMWMRSDSSRRSYFKALLGWHE